MESLFLDQFICELNTLKEAPLRFLVPGQGALHHSFRLHVAEQGARLGSKTRH